ncbi:mas-related G-protein coupled receptor member H-like [Dendrobates tinctorius]|uniref:mas-related G-protein coupled receptor member H-like n=1 Tax=Dendrobates tinctorius TaxID=92724 RepID=UPI003CCA5702
MNNTTSNTINQNRTEVGYTNVQFTLTFSICILLCLIGLIGNITVFWYLCFKIKKNKFTIYIINLSMADFLFLIFSSLIQMIYINTLVSLNPNFQGKKPLLTFLEIFYDTAQYSGMLILTAVSLERCLSVVFPFWYQCHRPEKLSTIICGSAWLLGCAESLTENLVCTNGAFSIHTTECTAVQIMTFGLSIVICLPIMVVSSIILLITVRRTFNHQYPTKFYIIIIVAVVIFISSVIPFNFAWFLMYFRLLPSNTVQFSLHIASSYSTALNCTLDPYIYFLIGKKWKQKKNQSIQDALERAFRIENGESNDSKSNQTANTSSQIHLPSAF